MSELLKLESLSIDYKVKDGYLSAVSNVNLAVNKGEIVAIVGESGCGKSTIAHSIMRLLPDHNERISGKIIFNGQNLCELSDGKIEEIRGRKISIIFQNPLDSLNPVYRTGKQVYEAVHIDERDSKICWERVIKLFKDVRMPDADKQIESFPHEISGGMRQRVMIAMMLSRNPELLIADEPTTALDVTIEAQILDILCSLRKEFNTSILLITHNFGIVAEIADRIVVMYAGQMVEQGDVYSIFDEPAHPYTRLLIKALPRISKHTGRIETIEGSVPRMTVEHAGCRFANRCPQVQQICYELDPPLYEVSSGHTCSCHFGEGGNKRE